MYPLLCYIGSQPVWTSNFMSIAGIIMGFAVLYINTIKIPVKTRAGIFLLAAVIFIPFLLGAKAWAVIEYMLLQEPVNFKTIFSIYGPYSIWGGLFLAVLTLFPAAAFFKVNSWDTADLLAISGSFGGVIAKLGCFLNGCCFGIPCAAGSAGAVFAAQSPAAAVFPDTALYPVQLYEALAWLAIFIVISLLKNKKPFSGSLLIISGIVYSLFRFFMEFYRYHETKAFISFAQIWSVLVFTSGIALFIVLLKTGQKSYRHKKH
jgi:phosphatidylglycerol---prolipoprotein diacylglyceryl transferase